MQKITRIAAVLLIALAVLLAIVAFSLGRRAMKPASAPVAAASSSPAETATPAVTTVVTAASALPAGQPIAASALRLGGDPQPPPGSYAKLDAVAGDIPLVDIPAGTTITAGLLAHGVALALKPGERALALPVDELSGAGNRILAGDYVDVFLSLKPAQAAANDHAKELTQTRLLLSRLRVLAYGSQDLPSASSSANRAAVADKSLARSDSATAPPPPHTAVLAVPVDQVDRLLLGTQDGKLSLALRHPDDNGQPDDGLFPQPRQVLSPLAGLSAEQRQQLQAPENRAYAGIDGSGLAGQASAGSRPATPHHAGATQGIEIIRGTQAHSL